MGYWQSKVVPKIKKVFEKNTGKKTAAAEACKTFDDSKEEYSKEFEEKKGELQAKVTELYESLTVEIKGLIKEPKPSGLKKHSAAVEKFLDDLSKFEFPGSKPAYEATTKYGATYVSGPIFFVFEKVSTFVVVEEVKEKEVEVPAAEAATATATATTTEETSGTEKEKEKEKEIVIEEEKKEAVVAEPAPEPEKTEKTEAAPAEAAAKVEEECAPTEPPKA